MHLNRTLKKLTGVLACLPILYLLVAIALVPWVMDDDRVAALGRGDLFSDELGVPAVVFIAVTGLVVLLNYGAMIFLMVHAGMNRQLEVGWKVAWIVLLLFGNIVVYPIYWYRQVWCDGVSTPLSRRGRQVWAAVSAFPIVWLVFIVVIRVAMDGGDDDALMILWALVFDVVFFPMWIYTIVHIIRDADTSAGAKAAWVALIVCTCLVSMPVYWLVGASPRAR